MQCPYCQNPETKVVDKRDAGRVSRRRRECGKCEKRFSTLEEVEEARLKVIKKDGTREDFNKDKIKRGIDLACMKRQVSTDRIDQMIINIEEKLRRKGKEVQASYIGELVSKELKKVDNVAYIRFASIYRAFTDISDFKKEIKELVRQ